MPRPQKKQQEVEGGRGGREVKAPKWSSVGPRLCVFVPNYEPNGRKACNGVQHRKKKEVRGKGNRGKLGRTGKKKKKGSWSKSSK